MNFLIYSTSMYCARCQEQCVAKYEYNVATGWRKNA